MTEALIDNLIQDMGGAIHPMTDNEDIVGGKSRKNRETTESTKKVYMNNIIRLNNKFAL